MSDETKHHIIDLPHGSWLDTEHGYVTVCIDQITITFSPDDFLEFAEKMGDVAQVLENMTDESEVDCPTCGTHGEVQTITPPSDDDYN